MNRKIYLIFLLLLSLCSCARKAERQVRWLDSTDDLYHRIQAGLFIPGEDWMMFRTFSDGPMPHPNLPVKFRWERGEFTVRSNEDCLVAVKPDAEIVFSHLMVAGNPYTTLARVFMEVPGPPIR